MMNCGMTIIVIIILFIFERTYRTQACPISVVMGGNWRSSRSVAVGSDVRGASWYEMMWGKEVTSIAAPIDTFIVHPKGCLSIYYPLSGLVTFKTDGKSSSSPWSHC
jgi:hypothetical protein